MPKSNGPTTRALRRAAHTLKPGDKVSFPLSVIEAEVVSNNPNDDNTNELTYAFPVFRNRYATTGSDGKTAEHIQEAYLAGKNADLVKLVVICGAQQRFRCASMSEQGKRDAANAEPKQLARAVSVRPLEEQADLTAALLMGLPAKEREEAIERALKSDAGPDAEPDHPKAEQ